MLETIEGAEAPSLALPCSALPRQAVPRRALPSPALPCHAAPSPAQPHPYKRKLERVLARMGGLYLADDILSAIAAGKMQSFVENDSWAVTQICLFPRARVLEILVVVGNLQDLRVLHDQVVEFANRISATIIQTYGRRGWLPDAKQRGWKTVAKNFVYHKEM